MNSVGTFTMSSAKPVRARSALARVVAVLVGCDVAMTAPEGSYSVDLASNSVVSAGKALALSCLASHSIEGSGDLSAYTFWIVPGASMDSEGHASDGYDLPNAGVTDFNAQRIYVVQLYATDKRAWAHEFLHVLTGSRDHPDFFRSCGLYGVRRRR